jgi:glucokinase
MPGTVGVDLGGTKIAIGMVGEQGRVLASHVRPTHAERGPQAVIADIIAGTKECLASCGQSAAALGIGVAGQVDAATGTVHSADNLHWREVPLGNELRKGLGLPVLVTNDVRAATWGEWAHGAGQGVADLVTIFIGTGVGGGIVSGGRMVTGHTNTAGEIGHMTVVTGGRQCHCRNQGCLEAYVGGWAIAARAQEAVAADTAAGARLLALAGSRDEINAHTVGDAYREHDPLAVRLVRETAHYLAAGLVTIVNAINPCMIIFGGGVVDGLPDLVPLAEPQARAHALQTPAAALRIATAALGDQAGIVGAAAMARSAVAVGR